MLGDRGTCLGNGDLWEPGTQYTTTVNMKSLTLKTQPYINELNYVDKNNLYENTELCKIKN